MSGIYLHIPFCKQACHYCNFHFSTSLSLMDEMIDCMCEEIRMRSDYLDETKLESIYFGGGTPSLLTRTQLDKIMSTINSMFQLESNIEITLEANPDDLTSENLEVFKAANINRLSIGIQSFFDRDLKYFNRAHNADQAHQCLEEAKSIGFENLTVDLIYGSPTTDHLSWEENIEKVFDYKIPHISAYCLTVEPKTALSHFISKGEFEPLDDSHAAAQFDILMQKTSTEGFEHYEISNFAKGGYLAVHNSNYWKNKSYLGIGPSAHSYNGISRQWNIQNNPKYIKGIRSGNRLFEEEILSIKNRFNEYLMTGLRTKWGVSEEKMHDLSPEYLGQFRNLIQHVNSEHIKAEDGSWTLTNLGKHFADAITAALFVD